MKHSSFQRKSQFAHHHWHHVISGLKECGPCMHPHPYQHPHPWTIWLLTNPSGLGPSLRALANWDSPIFLAKNKAILFFTSYKALSLRFINWVSGYRGQIWLQIFVVLTWAWPQEGLLVWLNVPSFCPNQLLLREWRLGCLGPLPRKPAPWAYAVLVVGTPRWECNSRTILAAAKTTPFFLLPQPAWISYSK